MQNRIKKQPFSIQIYSILPLFQQTKIASTEIYINLSVIITIRKITIYTLIFCIKTLNIMDTVIKIKIYYILRKILLRI